MRESSHIHYAPPGERARTGRKGLFRLAAAALLTAAMMIAPGAVKAVYAIDLSLPVSLTVTPSSEEFKEDIQNAGVMIDLYRVADAVPLGGSDTYTYQVTEPFASLDSAIHDPEITNEKWKGIAQQALAIALSKPEDPAAPTIVNVAPAASGAVNQKITDGMTPGLYLVVARGQSVPNYLTTIAADDGSGNTELATMAESLDYTYMFSPELVSIPGKPLDEEGVQNTANPGEWIYDVVITLKPAREIRNGSLAIIKKLQAFETKDAATFVFQIEAVRNGQQVFSDVRSMVFTDAGWQTIIIDDLPVGAEVTVTEVYSGANYRVTVEGGDVQTAVIEANVSAADIQDPEDPLSHVATRVYFDNTYDDTYQGGGSIENRFSNDGVNGWQWDGVREDGTHFTLNTTPTPTPAAAEQQ